MALQVIGAGVGRTGTTSLKWALERLLAGRCYHMWEVYQHPAHIPMWRSAVDGSEPDWDALFGGFVATVDWPGAAFWRQLTTAYPDALVLLSRRESPDAWYESAGVTIGEALRRAPTREMAEWHEMATTLVDSTFTRVPFERAAATRAYESHLEQVRSSVPNTRLLEWQVGDGWGPICARLGLEVPDEPFPHVNTRDDYEQMLARTAAPKRRGWFGRR